MLAGSVHTTAALLGLCRADDVGCSQCLACRGLGDLIFRLFFIILFGGNNVVRGVAYELTHVLFCALSVT